MNSEHAELWQRIVSFSFDSPKPVSFPFAARLARENGWPLAFAERAILEYKRFAFLAKTAGHPVCPSEQVDQVWHLHLTYTRSYWDEFCKKVLGRPLHHDPTRGGASEAKKHDRMYEATLVGYHRVFGSEPPPEFWPPSHIRFGEDIHERRVNVRKNWVIPKGPVHRRLATAAILLVGLGFASGCVGPILANGGIDGPTFLLLYAAVFVGVLALAIFVRNKLRTPADPIDINSAPLDCYDLALLAGGPRRVFDTAVLRLIASGCLRYTSDGKLELLRNPDPPDNSIESEIVARVDVGDLRTRPLSEVRKGILLDLDANRKRLEDMGLLLGAGPTTQALRLTAFSVFLVPLLMGLPRIVTGFQNQVPTCFLAFLTFMSFVVAIAVFARRPRRTIRGDRYVKERAAQPRGSTSSNGQPQNDLILATALLGTAALAGTEYDSLRKSLYPRGTDSSSSSGCSSGCGSGCGAAGGGDGGGGCGGGCGGGGD